MWKSIVAVSVGASLGALLRWWLGMQLDSIFPTIPPGTLLANLIGGYVIGLAMATFSVATTLAPEWRLLVVTGFCSHCQLLRFPAGANRRQWLLLIHTGASF